jgi:transaldolase
VQRPLWASTGVKNPAYPDTMYVDQLVAPDTVNTMPEKTLDAVADHGRVTGDTVRPWYAAARQTFGQLAALGVDMHDVVQVLEVEGVDKFDASWQSLLDSLKAALAQASGAV